MSREILFFSSPGKLRTCGTNILRATAFASLRPTSNGSAKNVFPLRSAVTVVVCSGKVITKNTCLLNNTSEAKGLIENCFQGKNKGPIRSLLPSGAWRRCERRSGW